METDVKLTKLSKCAGCGAKVGAGTLAKLLQGFETVYDPELIVGYDKSDDACVYILDDDKALVQTLDFFPPIVDDPFLYGQIAAANALSDIYAMGGEPKLALNIMCFTKTMEKQTIMEILRGGYAKAYEAGTVIAGGHTIHGTEPLYGLSVSGFVHPEKVLTNSGAKPGDIMILTKPLGIGILTTANRAEMVEESVMKKIYEQMAALNRASRNIMVKYFPDSCTDITGFSLLGHGLEMAQGSNCTIHFSVNSIPYHREALEMARMGFIPEGAYRNREFAEQEINSVIEVSREMMDILFDPQTSGGLMMAIPEKNAGECLKELQENGIAAEIIGYVTEETGSRICLE